MTEFSKLNSLNILIVTQTGLKSEKRPEYFVNTRQELGTRMESDDKCIKHGMFQQRETRSWYNHKIPPTSKLCMHKTICIIFTLETFVQRSSDAIFYDNILF